MLYRYCVYIITNKNKTVLYTGVTNDLKRRLLEHKEGCAGSFTTKYGVCYLLYYEDFQSIEQAIAREKEIKGWNRLKKERLIGTSNPNWNFLGEEEE